MKTLPACLTLILLLASASTVAADELIQPGLYEIRYRLEMPHLERYALERTAVVCIGKKPGEGKAPLPVLAAKSAFSGCRTGRLRHGSDRLSYQIACSDRDASRAEATYDLADGSFRGRIAMVIGAKNMTMTEFQSGSHLGACETDWGWQFERFWR